MKEITRELESVEPSGALLDLLASVNVHDLADDQKVTAYIIAKKIKAFADHVQLAILDGVEDTTEVAMAATESEQAVVRRKELSQVLGVLPRLSDQLRRGDLELRQLEAVYERVRRLPTPELIAEVEDALLDAAPGLNRTRLCRQTSRLVALADPAGYAQRHQKATEDRRVEFSPLPDGMAALTWVLSADQARLIHEQVCADARTLPKDERTTDQKRCDVLLDRVMGTARDLSAQIHVTVSLETLLGLTEEPGRLDGYGPIPADMARELAMHNPWRAVLLGPYRHAEAISTQKYRPTRAMRELSIVRDGGTCTAPGCNSPIQELDHVTPWPQGETRTTQLTGFCSWHHHRKHDNHHAALDPDSTLRWTTPQGRTYETRPHQY